LLGFYLALQPHPPVPLHPQDAPHPQLPPASAVCEQPALHPPLAPQVAPLAWVVFAGAESALTKFTTPSVASTNKPTMIAAITVVFIFYPPLGYLVNWGQK
jgi:hypothetical protein